MSSGSPAGAAFSAIKGMLGKGQSPVEQQPMGAPPSIFDLAQQNNFGQQPIPQQPPPDDFKRLSETRLGQAAKWMGRGLLG